MNRKYFLKALCLCSLSCMFMVTASCSGTKDTPGSASPKSTPQSTPRPLVPNETVSETSNDEFEVQISDKNARFFGRTYTTSTSSKTTYYFNWTNSGFEIAFEGTKVEAEFSTNMPGSDVGRPYLLVFVDGKENPEDAAVIELNKTRQYYTLAENLPEGKHTIKVIKRTEVLQSTAGVSKLKFPGGSKLFVAQDSLNTRKIEFIGDSITCGFGNISPDPNGNFETKTEDGWQTYAAISARNLQADANYTAVSGWAINKSPYGADIPSIYEFTDGINYKAAAKNGSDTKWDFSRFQPDVVVINLGTNDNAYCGNDDTKLREFQQAYLNFLNSLRTYYPNAHIVCSIGMMTGTDMKLMDSLLNAFNDFNDSNSSILKFPLQNVAEDGAGCGHPSLKTHEKCAALLTNHLKEVMNWQ